MPISTVKQLCTPSALVTSDSLVEQVAQLEDFATGKIDGREFFRRNHFTAGLELLVKRGFERLAAKTDDGAFYLTQAMGGGKAPNPATEKKRQNADNAGRQQTYRNKKAVGLAASANSDSLSDVKVSPGPNEHEVLTEKFVEMVRNWARGKSVVELQRVISEITDSGDGFPETLSSLIQNKSALAQHAATSVVGGAVT